MIKYVITMITQTICRRTIQVLMFPIMRSKNVAIYSLLVRILVHHPWMKRSPKLIRKVYSGRFILISSYPYLSVPTIRFILIRTPGKDEIIRKSQ
jgi:hypothetical protein